MRVRSATIGAAIAVACGASCSTRVDPPAPIELPDVRPLDHDGDRLDDRFREELDAIRRGDTSRGRLDDEVVVDIVLSRPVDQAERDRFAAAGGRITYEYRAVGYGWLGLARRSALERIAATLGPSLLLVHAPRPMRTHLDEATRCGRVRPIWAQGISGASDTTIAIVDTGVDVSHTDLASRMQGFHDYTASGDPTSRDPGGHGTHVAGIATGTGAAFGAGGSTLFLTTWGDLTSVGAGGVFHMPLHTPAYFGVAGSTTVTATASWSTGASTSLQLQSASDGTSAWSPLRNANGTSPLTDLPVTADPPVPPRVTSALFQSNPAGVGRFAVAMSITGYPAVGDGFNALRGVAPGCSWFNAKVFDDNGNGTGAQISAAVDDLVVRRVTDSIKVINMSLGLTPGGTVDTVVRSHVNNAVANGIVVVISAGNDGPSTAIGDPGRAANAITVGASNDLNQLTEYTSIGFTPNDASDDFKPDVLAPGGSFYRSLILSTDSNTSDGATLPDAQANDYTNLAGTSMAAPFVSGSAALVIDAMQRAGTTWTFASSAQPLFVKMLLSASATETGVGREQGLANPPTLGRAAAPKDPYEGYGLVSPEAAVEALMTPFASPLTGSVGDTRPEWDRRAWGANVALVAGTPLKLTLDNPPAGDFDVYVYSSTPAAKGNPTILASSTVAGEGVDESLSFTPAASETAYVFVKRVSGSGSFVLRTTALCGDGIVDPGEDCEVGACCSACKLVNGLACDDGSLCTTTDVCIAGVCAGTPVACPPADDCHTTGTCDPGSGACTPVAKADGAPCAGGACTAGVCVPGAPADAGEPDAGEPDASAPDASAPDASAPDGSTPPDASAPIDSGAPSGSSSSGGSPVAPPPAASSSAADDGASIGGDGGCRASPSSPSAASELVLALLFLCARRRRGR